MPPPESPAPRAVVLIASAGRPEMLGHLLVELGRQTRVPDEVWVSVPAEADRPSSVEASTYALHVLEGARGASAQRNRALDAMTLPDSIVLVLDDDVVLADDYVAATMAAFAARPDMVGATGHRVADGSLSGEIPRQRARSILDAEPRRRREGRTRGLRGSNMLVRGEALHGERFDERLPLYSWLEDLDLSRRLARRGELRALATCRCVHLGAASGGRTQHMRFGYSQIANPVYLWRKGTVPLRDLVLVVLLPVGRNLLQAAVSADRRARLRGNVTAVLDVVRRRSAPERMLDLSG